ncbi:MAG: ATP-binding protein [Bacteroidales bacterium]|nr:ATP-binding protein [Bacteroidales bacterium]MCF8390180.1 ATP-binding protein [Bacteroidales bacterium]
MKKRLYSPFPTSGYYGPEYFCDRENESELLMQNARGGNSTTLISLRRLGKTALIKHVNHLLKAEFLCIYIDILPAENLDHMMNFLATSIANSVEEKSTTGKKIWNYLRSLRPVISYDNYSGTPSLSFSMGQEGSKNQLAGLFRFLEEQSVPVLLAIDEFQQILNFPEKNIDAWFRSLMQELNNVVFIYSGSEQHLVNEMFSSPSKPFYRSSQIVNLHKIDDAIYTDFIIQKFSERGKTITEEIVNGILKWTDTHTYYVQLLLNRLFLVSGKKISEEEWKNEAYKLLKEQEYVFFGYRDLLSPQQWKLLKACALDNKVYEPTSSEFVNSHTLGSPSTVLRSLHSLLSKEILYKHYDSDGKHYYAVYDVLFKRWIGMV